MKQWLRDTSPKLGSTRLVCSLHLIVDPIVFLQIDAPDACGGSDKVMMRAMKEQWPTIEEQ